MSNVTDYIIIGNGVAGNSAAEAIRASDSSGSIKIFTEEKYPFYARVRLPQFIADEVPLEKLILKNDKWYKEKNIDLYLNEPVIDANPDEKTITTIIGRTFSYNKLLLATGSHSFIPQIKGVKAKQVFSLRNLEDAIKIKNQIKGKKNAIIIGGGLLGLETGKALMSHGLEVAVVENSDRLLPRQMDASGARILRCMMEKMGYKFYMGLGVKEIVEEGGRLILIMNDNSTITGDMILISAGVRPNLLLAERLGLSTRNGVIVNDYLQTSKQDIFSAGDIAEHNSKIYGIWPAAKDQGTAAGKNMAGVTEKYTGTTMSNVLKVAGINLTSIGDIDAENKNRNIINIDDENGIYKKYVIKDDILIGCILLGDTKEQKTLERAISEKKHIDEIQKELIPALYKETPRQS